MRRVSLIARSMEKAEDVQERFRLDARSALEVRGGGLGGAISANPGSLSNMSFGRYTQTQAHQADQYGFFNGYPYAIINAIANRLAAQPIRVARILPPGVKSRKAFRPRWDTVNGGARSYPLVPKSFHDLAMENRLELMPQHRIVRAIEDPNQFMIRHHLLYSTYASIEITGRGYWWMFSDEETGRDQIWPIPSHWIVPVHEEEQLFAYYQVTLPGTGQIVKVPTNQIVPFMIPDPSDPFAALAPMQAMARTVMTDFAFEMAQRMSMENGINPGLAIMVGKPPEFAGVGGDQMVLTAEQRNQIISAVRRQYRGVTRFDEPLILDALIKDVKPITTAPKEMAYKDSHTLIRNRLTQGWGMNPITLGELEGVNYASSGMADHHVCRMVYSPRVESSSQTLSCYVPPYLGDADRDGAPDREGRHGPRRNRDIIVYVEPVVPSDPEMDMNRDFGDLDRGVINRNEMRRKRGLDPVEGLDEYADPSGGGGGGGGSSFGIGDGGDDGDDDDGSNPPRDQDEDERDDDDDDDEDIRDRIAAQHAPRRRVVRRSGRRYTMVGGRVKVTDSSGHEHAADGKFGRGGGSGGGDDSEADTGADAGPDEPDHSEKHDEWSDEDVDIERSIDESANAYIEKHNAKVEKLTAVRAKDDAADHKERQAFDAKITARREKLESGRKKEDADIQKKRDKEDADVQKVRDKQDAEIEKKRAKLESFRESQDADISDEREAQDAKLSKTREKLDAGREKEDSALANAREKHDDKIIAAREKEDTAREKRQEKEQAKAEADHAAATAENEAAEEKDVDAQNERHEAESDAYSAELDAQGVGPERKIELMKEQRNRHYEEYAALAKLHSDRQAATDAALDAVGEIHQKETDAVEAARAAEDAKDEADRKAEDAELQSKRDAEDAALEAEESKLEESRAAQDAGLEAERDAQDEEINNLETSLQDARDEEDTESTEQRDTEDAEIQERRDAEDSALDETEAEEEKRREEDDNRIAGEREAEDAALEAEYEEAMKGFDEKHEKLKAEAYKRRQKEHPEAHATFYSDEDHAKHGGGEKRYGPRRLKALPAHRRGGLVKVTDDSGHEHDADGRFGSGGGGGGSDSGSDSKPDADAHDSHESTGSEHDSDEELAGKAKKILGGLKKFGAKAVAAAKSLKGAAQNLVEKGAIAVLSGEVDMADILETPSDAAKLCNDKATNAQIADMIGIPMNSMVLGVVANVLAYGYVKIKQFVGKKIRGEGKGKGLKRLRTKGEKKEKPDKAAIMTAVLHAFLPKLGVHEHDLPTLAQVQDRMERLANGEDITADSDDGDGDEGGDDKRYSDGYPVADRPGSQQYSGWTCPQCGRDNFEFDTACAGCGYLLPTDGGKFRLKVAARGRKESDRIEALVDEQHEVALTAFREAVEPVLAKLGAKAAVQVRSSLKETNHFSPMEVAQRAIDSHAWEVALQPAIYKAVYTAAVRGAALEWTIFRDHRMPRKDASVGAPQPPSWPRRVYDAAATAAQAVMKSGIVKAVVDGVIGLLRRALRKGQKSGQAGPELADKVVGQVLVGAGTATNTDSIARDHGASAVNAGQFQVRRELEQRGAVAVTEWRSMEDNKVRPSHRAAHGQRVRPGRAFKVAGYDCYYPGDPGLPPEQRCRCRCRAITFYTNG